MVNLWKFYKSHGSCSYKPLLACWMLKHIYTSCIHSISNIKDSKTNAWKISFFLIKPCSTRHLLSLFGRYVLIHHHFRTTCTLRNILKFIFSRTTLQKRILSFWCDSTSSLTILMVSSGFLNWNNNMIEVNKRNSFRYIIKGFFSYAMFCFFLLLHVYT